MNEIECTECGLQLPRAFALTPPPDQCASECPRCGSYYAREIEHVGTGAIGTLMTASLR